MEYDYRGRKKQNNIIPEIIGVLLLILVFSSYWDKRTPKADIPGKSEQHPILQAIDDTRKLDMSLETERGENANTIYVTVTYTNHTIKPFYNIRSTASLLDANENIIEEKYEKTYDTIDAGETVTYTFTFSGGDYTSVSNSYVYTEYQRSH